MPRAEILTLRIRRQHTPFLCTDALRRLSRRIFQSHRRAGLCLAQHQALCPHISVYQHHRTQLRTHRRGAPPQARCQGRRRTVAAIRSQRSRWKQKTHCLSTCLMPLYKFVNKARSKIQNFQYTPNSKKTRYGSKTRFLTASGAQKTDHTPNKC